MAHHESDREDLLREATALVERAELKIPGYADPVVVGFRRDGSASFFFGPDPVYQFNSAGELRRAFVAGLLYKAERGKLIELRRERSATETALIRRELTSDQFSTILTSLDAHLNRLREALEAGMYTLIGQVPDDRDVVNRIKDWFGTFSRPSRIASTPNVR